MERDKRDGFTRREFNWMVLKVIGYTGLVDGFNTMLGNKGIAGLLNECSDNPCQSNVDVPFNYVEIMTGKSKYDSISRRVAAGIECLSAVTLLFVNRK